MSAEGWIFMVGFRVFDVGLLVLWLVWFFRLRDDDDGGFGDDGPGGGGPEPSPAGDRGPGGLALPLGSWSPGPRSRSHGGSARGPRPRRGSPLPQTSPARVRQPGAPAQAPRRA